jgi:flagellar hook assembly protein FlgD
MDLVMHFDTQAIVAALGMVTDGEMRELTLDVETYAGIGLEAKDCVWIKHKVKDPTPPPKIFTRTFDGSGTQILLSLGDVTDVSMVVYDVQGRQVKTLVNGALTGGTHTISWNGRDQAGNTVADGVYFCHVKAGTVEQTAKMLLAQ